MKAITLILLFTASVLAWSKGGAGTWPVDSFESPFEIRYRDIRNVYDGDTLTLNCPNCKKGKLRIRLMGVDTPEMRAQCDAEKQLAIKARDFLQGFEMLKKKEQVDLANELIAEMRQIVSKRNQLERRDKEREYMK